MPNALNALLMSHQGGDAPPKNMLDVLKNRILMRQAIAQMNAPRDIREGEQGLQGGFTLGNVGGVDINATDFLPMDLGTNALLKGMVAAKSIPIALAGMTKGTSKNALTIPIYHGTTPEAAKIIDKAGFDVKKSADGTVWFTVDPNIGEVAASGKGGIVKRQIDPNKLKLATWDDVDKYGIDELISKGFHGVKYEDEGQPTNYQIFFPEMLFK